MRFALTLAIALSASMVLADEGKEPVKYVQGVGLVVNEAMIPKVGPYRPESTQGNLAPEPKEPERKFLVVVGENNFQVFCAGEQPAKDSPWKVWVRCDEVSVQTNDDESVRLHFINCAVEMPDGVSGHANTIEYDFTSNVLALSGLNDEEVSLVFEGAEASRTIRAPKVVLEIKPNLDSKPSLQPAVK